MNAKNKTKQSDTCCGSQCVCLELARPDAQEVGIAGSFNDWHPSVTPMIPLNDGKWVDDPAARTLPPRRRLNSSPKRGLHRNPGPLCRAGFP